MGAESIEHVEGTAIDGQINGLVFALFYFYESRSPSDSDPNPKHFLLRADRREE